MTPTPLRTAPGQSWWSLERQYPQGKLISRGLSCFLFFMADYQFFFRVASKVCSTPLSAVFFQLLCVYRPALVLAVLTVPFILARVICCCSPRVTMRPSAFRVPQYANFFLALYTWLVVSMVAVFFIVFSFFLCFYFHSIIRIDNLSSLVDSFAEEAFHRGSFVMMIFTVSHG